MIGAGAAGLLAGVRSAERGRQTLILEKNRKPGVKILMSGGTRCNITHNCDAEGIIAAFGSAGSFLHSPLASLGPAALVELLEAEGLPTKVEHGGKVFPQSDRAADVLEALLRRMRRSGAGTRSRRASRKHRTCRNGVQRSHATAATGVRQTHRHDRRSKLPWLRHRGRRLRVARKARPYDSPPPPCPCSADERRGLGARAIWCDDP